MVSNINRSNPDPKDFFENLQTKLPLKEKIRLIIKNNWIKIKHRQSCCGHPGEPGC
jgi:hypothetical protein